MTILHAPNRAPPPPFEAAVRAASSAPEAQAPTKCDRDRPWSRAWRQHGWQAILPAGLFGLVVLLISDSATQDAICTAFSAIAAAAFIFGTYPCRRYRPKVWAFIILGIGIGFLSELPLSVFLEPVFDPAYLLTLGGILGLAGYGLVAVSLFALVQDRHRNFDRTALIIDSIILIIGLTLLYWLGFIDLVADSYGVSLPLRAAAALNPILDIVFLGVAMRFLLIHQARSRVNPRVVGLMAAASVLALVSDSGAAYAALTNSPVLLTLVYGLGVLAWTFWAAFALHPDLLTMLNPTDVPGESVSYRRLLSLGLIAILAPAIIGLRWALGEDPQVPILAPIATALVILVLARMIIIVRALQTSLVQRDILAGKLEEARVRDPLTGLDNRRRLTDKLEELMIARRPAALMLLDLDDFKAVNDSLGHAAGDTVIQLVAARLKEILPSAEMIARLGADEFAILLTDADQIASLPDLAARVVRAMDSPVNIGDKLVYVHLSAGIARANNDLSPTGLEILGPMSFEGVFELLRDAEIAMFLAKSRGKGRFEIFQTAMLDSIVAHTTALADLERAIEAGEIESYYQPIVDLRSGAIVGAEALARWQHPERGLIAPNEFIGLAESSGLILPLGNQLLEAACMQAALWPADRSGAAPCLHANLTVRQLHTFGAVESIARCLRISGLDPSRLALEVLESTLVDAEAISVLWGIHALGVKLFLDDFGTGYSALGYLSSLPLDGIKIDRAFITPLTTDKRDYDILEGILGIAHNLNLEVIAEGVETVEQRRVLVNLRGFIGQGYLFSRAVPAAEFRAMLAHRKAARPQAA